MFLASCQSSEVGRLIMQAEFDHVVENTTTKKKIHQLFGTPAQTILRVDATQDLYVYKKTKSEFNWLGLIPIYGLFVKHKIRIFTQNVSFLYNNKDVVIKKSKSEKRQKGTHGLFSGTVLKEQ